MLLWVLQKGRQEEEQGWRGQERACGSLTAAQCRTKQSVAGQATGQPRGGDRVAPGFLIFTRPHTFPMLATQKPLSQTELSRLMICCSSRSVGGCATSSYL